MGIVRALASDWLGLSVKPTQSIELHLRGAADWLCRAQAATPDDGVAHSFDIKSGKWQASYPETTGYIIPTLYDYAKNYSEPTYAAAALKMAN